MLVPIPYDNSKAGPLENSLQFLDSDVRLLKDALQSLWQYRAMIRYGYSQITL